MSKIARNIMRKTLTGAVVLGLVLQSVPTSAAVAENVKDQKVVEAKESPKVEQAKMPAQKVENKVENSALAKDKALKDKTGIEVKEKVKDEKKVEVTKAKEETK
ncbi:hypothetical protein, partial [Clostridium sp. HBUAS56017]|uniref:hypothetical protein n=1 Tax=Clostridium sp. HBUAS56017 TaxID=2571128 RepID=UPI001A9BCACB